jgi:hypothetical protein
MLSFRAQKTPPAAPSQFKAQSGGDRGNYTILPPFGNSLDAEVETLLNSNATLILF